MLDLIDDGTLDTVFRCPDCGAEERFGDLSEYRDESGALSDDGVEYATESHDCEPLRLIVGAEGFIYRGDDTDADVERLRALLDGAVGSEWDTLAEASEILGGFGVEHVAVEGRGLAYVNAGDTYTTTLAHDGTEYVVTSWGDWYEKAEEAYAEESGEDRCRYCGEWGEFERVPCGHGVCGDNWCERGPCPSCGNEG